MYSQIDARPEPRSAKPLAKAHARAVLCLGCLLSTVRPTCAHRAHSASPMPDFDDVLSAHYAANPHVAAQVASNQRATGATEQTVDAAQVGGDDAILRAHYSASPHVAAQVASNKGSSSPPADKAAPPTPPSEVGGETFQPAAPADSSGIALTPLTGLFEVRRRGKITYYTQPGGIISSLVTRRDSDGDLTIHFAGLTGGTSVTDRDYLGHGSDLARMAPEIEIPRVFDCWGYWLKEAGLCDSLADVDLIEMQVFGCQPKDVNPLTSPQEYADECTRLRTEYGTAYRKYFDERDMAFPCRYTVHLVDSPDTAASYEFYSVGLLQKGGSGGGAAGAKL
jgi:hypothetical protein